MAILKKLTRNLYTFKKDKNKKKKMVTFMDDDNIATINHVARFDENENLNDQLWFSIQDQDKAKARDQKIMTTVRILNNTSSSAEQIIETQMGESSRGLENRHGVEATLVTERYVRSIGSVISMQKLFRKLHRDGSDSIARAYNTVCVDAVNNAIIRAKEDERFVLDHIIREEARTNISNDFDFANQGEGQKLTTNIINMNKKKMESSTPVIVDESTSVHHQHLLSSKKRETLPSNTASLLVRYTHVCATMQ